MTVFARCKNAETDVAVRPAAFADAIGGLSQGFAQQIDLDKNMSLLVAYLAQEVPGQISYAKLTLALTQQPGESPLL